MGDFPEPPTPEQARRIYRAILHGRDVPPEDRGAALHIAELYGRRGPGWAMARVAAWVFALWQLYRVAFVPHTVGVLAVGWTWVTLLFSFLAFGLWTRWRLRQWLRRHPAPDGRDPGSRE